MSLSEASWRQAYDNYSLWGATDPNAPVKGSGEIVVNASQQRVWNVLSDVRSWPRLRPDIDEVTVEEAGGVKTGTSCILATAGVQLALKFGLMQPGRELNWVTAMPGLVMTNRYVILPRTEGTRIVCSETITAPAFPQFNDDVLAERIQVWLSAVKLAAEEPV